MLQQPLILRGILTDEGPYPCYEIRLTGAQVLDLMNQRLIDIDPTYQRGKTAPTARRAGQSVHALKPSRDHIESIRTDLATRIPEYGRNLAVIPPIWVNCRRAPDGTSYIQTRGAGPQRHASDDDRMILELLGPMYCFDGWHRALSIKGAMRDKQIDPGRRFMFMLFDAPLSFEAWAFRKLNSAGMPVKEARVAWVSAPFSEDLMRIAYEFATSNRNLSWDGQFNFETVKSTVSNGSPYYASFLAIANAFTAAPNTHLPVWPQTQIDPANPNDRKLVVEYMNLYWNRVVAIRPDLGFRSFAQRQAARATRPLLANNLMMQVLLWIGHEYLRADCALREVGYRDRLRYLLAHPQDLDQFFAGLEKLGDRGIFAADSKLFSGLVRASSGLWTKNDYAARRDVFARLRGYLQPAKTPVKTLAMAGVS